MKGWWSASGIVFLIGLELAMLAPPAFGQYFTIDRFRSEMTIHEDSSLTVWETIELTFSRPRHGIYREIPYQYRDDLGHTEETPIRVLSVTDGSGKPLKYKVRRRGSLIHIRIGDPEAFVNGPQTYTICYKVDNAILFLKDHDELYWNVTGNDWKAPIREAIAEVNLAV